MSTKVHKLVWLGGIALGAALLGLILSPFLETPHCVIEGTVIATPHGPRRIEDIEPGDEVLSKTATGEIVPSHVTAKHSYSEAGFLQFTFADGRSLGVTSSHPLRTALDWRVAGRVWPGDIVELHQGATRVSERVEVHSPVRVHDLTVLPHHNFFANGVLVHNKRPPEVQELQQAARFAIDVISRDVFQAWESLPPEFPAITTPEIDPSVGNHDPDVLEIVRTRLDPDVDPGPHAVAAFDGQDVVLEHPVPDLSADELVLIYNDGLNEARGWVLGRVSRVEDRVVKLATDSIPPAYQNLDRPFPWKGALTRVSVVRYFLKEFLSIGSDSQEKKGKVLMRLEDFSRVYPVGYTDDVQVVGYLEDLQVVYLLGLESMREVDDPPPVAIPATAETVLQSVRITVTGRARSHMDDRYIRKTFATSVALPSLLTPVHEGHPELIR